MGKKIFFAVTGGLALFGLAVCIVGYALGGRLGSISAMDGKLIYINRSEVINLGNVPSWWRWNSVPGLPIFGLNLFDEDESSAASGGDASTGGQPAQSAPLAADEVRRVEVNIAAGNLVIRSGSTFSIEADGLLEYAGSVRNGTWDIRSVLPRSGVQNENGRFWLDGRDITTTYTVTLPQSVQSLDIELGMGRATVEGLALENLECSTDMGRLEVTGVSADRADFEVNMGDILVTGFTAREAELDCELGGITLEGEVSRSLTADCELGGITIQVRRPASYSGRASASLGRVSVDGQHERGRFSGSFADGIKNTDLRFDLSCELGSIDLNFI